MGSYLSTQNNNLNILVSDSDNDDFYTKFLVRDTHLLYLFKNTIDTTHPSVDINSNLYKKIYNTYISNNINILKLDNNNDLIDIPEEEIINFKKNILKKIEHLKNEFGYEINILIDYSCYKFLQFIIEILDNDILHPQKINITFINNLTNISFSKNTKNINNLLRSLYDKSNEIYTTINYNVFDYCKSTGINSSLIQKPVYNKINISNILDENTSEFNKLLFDYYTEFHNGRMPLYLPITYIIKNNDFKLIESNKNLDSINLNFYKFINNSIILNKFISSIVCEIIKKIDANFY